MIKVLSLPLVRQETNYTCGAAAVKSVLQSLGRHFPESVLASRLGSNSKYGTPFNRIVEFFKSLEIDSHAKEDLSINDIEHAVNNHCPVIVAFQAWGILAQYEEGWDDGHYAVIIGFDNENFYFMDPLTKDSYTFISKEEFLTRWHDLDIDVKSYAMLRNFGIAVHYPADFVEISKDKFSKLN